MKQPTDRDKLIQELNATNEDTIRIIDIVVAIIISIVLIGSVTLWLLP